MHDFYDAAAEVRQQGPDQPAGRRRGGRAARADGARAWTPTPTARPTSTRCKTFLMSIRKGVTTITRSATSTTRSPARSSSARAGTATCAGSCRAARSRATSPPCIPTETSEIWADNWCIPATAPHPVAAHAWINWLLDPEHRGDRDEVPQLPDPDPERARPAARGRCSNDPLFNVPKTLHGQLQVHPQRQPAGRAGAHADLHGVQGRPDGRSPSRRRRGEPRRPATAEALVQRRATRRG